MAAAHRVLRSRPFPAPPKMADPGLPRKSGPGPVTLAAELSETFLSLPSFLTVLIVTTSSAGPVAVAGPQSVPCFKKIAALDGSRPAAVRKRRTDIVDQLATCLNQSLLWAGQGRTVDPFRQRQMSLTIPQVVDDDAQLQTHLAGLEAVTPQPRDHHCLCGLLLLWDWRNTSASEGCVSFPQREAIKCLAMSSLKSKCSSSSSTTMCPSLEAAPGQWESPFRKPSREGWNSCCCLSSNGLGLAERLRCVQSRISH